MSHPAIELQSLIHNTLEADAGLTSLIGTDGVFDTVPGGKQPPYVTFGKSVHSDWSTGTEEGMEHEFEIHSWTKKRGRKELFLIHEILVSKLTGLGGVMNEHNLVNITHEFTVVEARQKHRAFIGIATFRAITEPLT